jgi:uncharacterized protein YigE (DUF2233 family)
MSVVWSETGARVRDAFLFCVLTGLIVGKADAGSADAEAVDFRGGHFWVKTIDPAVSDLRLFLNDDQGVLLRDFAGLDRYVKAHGGNLAFAANAGMFEPDSHPVGLLVQNGTEQSPLNLRDGEGNFYMKPNGVFLIDTQHNAFVVESGMYPAVRSPVLWATQSGPLLVYGGDINPDFNAQSKSLKVRSGVGVRKDGTIVFALSRAPVTFYDFAFLFQSGLKCPNALYLDGEISAFYRPGVPDPVVHSFGPMFGLVEKKP